MKRFLCLVVPPVSRGIHGLVRQAGKCWCVRSSLCVRVHYAVLSAPYLNTNPKRPERGCSPAQQVEDQRISLPGETIAATRPCTYDEAMVGKRTSAGDPQHRLKCFAPFYMTSFRRDHGDAAASVTQTHERMVAGHIATLASRFPIPQRLIHAVRRTLRVGTRRAHGRSGRGPAVRV